MNADDKQVILQALSIVKNSGIIGARLLANKARSLGEQIIDMVKKKCRRVRSGALEIQGNGERFKNLSFFPSIYEVEFLALPINSCEPDSNGRRDWCTIRIEEDESGNSDDDCCSKIVMHLKWHTLGPRTLVWKIIR